MKTLLLSLFFSVLAVLLPAQETSGTLSASPGAAALIAVAANFAEPARRLAADLEERTHARIDFAQGSSGKQYALIMNGAPYDALLSADAERPRLLEAEGRGIKGTRFSYAIGRLVLWSPKPGVVDDKGAVLTSPSITHIAIAKPELAPYGLAAKQFLEARGLWDSLGGKLVLGDNISQAMQFTQTGNAQLGFIAYSQLLGLPEGDRGSWWMVPSSEHAPILQDAILLRENPVAREYLESLHSPAAREKLAAWGYELPALGTKGNR